MISKSTFQTFSLPNHTGSYFLRPDRILGCFKVDNHKFFKSSSASSRLSLSSRISTTNRSSISHLDKLSIDLLAVEKAKEFNLIETLNAMERKYSENIARIDSVVNELWKSLDEISFGDDGEDYEQEEEDGDRGGVRPRKDTSLIGLIMPTSVGRMSSSLNRRVSKEVDIFQTYRNSGSDGGGGGHLKKTVGFEMRTFPKRSSQEMMVEHVKDGEHMRSSTNPLVSSSRTTDRGSLV